MIKASEVMTASTEEMNKVWLRKIRVKTGGKRKGND